MSNAEEIFGWVLTWISCIFWGFFIWFALVTYDILKASKKTKQQIRKFAKFYYGVE